MKPFHLVYSKSHCRKSGDLILSLSDLFQNVGNHFETWNVGVLGPVTLEGLNEGRIDLTSQKWTYQVFRMCTT